VKYIANPVEVEAWKITGVACEKEQPFGQPQSYRLFFDDRERYVASAEMCSRLMPVVGDYLVQQADGYIYLNPKDVFERKYRYFGDLNGWSDE